jgi:hypothetical protein
MADGDLHTAVVETQSGQFYDFNDEEAMKAFILDAFEKFQTGTLHSSSKGLNTYSTQALTKKFLDIICG